MPNQKPTVRFAPSPTGYLHVGGLRTALYNFLFARQNNGKFILRIEDTDQARLVPNAEKNIVDTLETFGLEFDEGPFYQSERLDMYKKYADNLLEKDLAYEDEDAVRFRMPKEGKTEIQDIIRGRVEFENKTQEDFVIIKSDEFPTYNFAHVIDDYEMGITHVIRGEEFIPSTPKYVALHKALGWDVLKYAHLPLLLNKQKAKLSKREGDVAVTDFLKKGYLKEALLNFVALLGWHPKGEIDKPEKEVFSLDELMEEFDLSRVQKAGAIFDLDKLDWFQHVWVTNIYEQTKDDPEKHPLFERVNDTFKDRFGEIDESFLKLIWPNIIERMGKPEDMQRLADEFEFFFAEPEYSADILVWKKSTPETTKQALVDLKSFLQDLHEGRWTTEELEKEIKNFIKKSGLDNGTVLWPLRVALTGKEKSMGPFEIMEILNKANKRNVVFTRIDKAVERL